MVIKPSEARRIAQERDSKLIEEPKSLFEIGLEAALKRVKTEPEIIHDFEEESSIQDESLESQEEIKRVWIRFPDRELFDKYLSRILAIESQVLLYTDRDRDLPKLFKKLKFSPFEEFKLSDKIDYESLLSILNGNEFLSQELTDGKMLGSFDFSDNVKKNVDYIKNIIIRNFGSDFEYRLLLGEHTNGIVVDGEPYEILCFNCEESSIIVPGSMGYCSTHILAKGEDISKLDLYIHLNYRCGECKASLAHTHTKITRNFIFDDEIPYIL